jgi:hypothetical protein
MNIDINDEQLYKLFILTIGVVAEALYEDSEVYFNFPHFKVQRAKFKNNLIQIDIKKDGEVFNAKSLLNFYMTEGMERKVLDKVIKDYVDNLMDYSMEKEEEDSDIISKLNKRKVSKRKNTKGT